MLKSHVWNKIDRDRKSDDDYTDDDERVCHDDYNEYEHQFPELPPPTNIKQEIELEPYMVVENPVENENLETKSK